MKSYQGCGRLRWAPLIIAIVSSALPACTARAPSRAGARVSAVTVGADGGCSVELTKVSYDDPGSDDAELVELGVSSPHGSGATLADCGLASLEHINGVAGARCGDVVLALELDAVVVPDDGYVTICTSDCDVDPGKDGWLQNGPDALRFLDTEGGVSAVVAWRGDPNECYSDPGVDLFELVKESPPSDGPDDVNIWCDGAFVLDEQGASLRSPNVCPSPDAGFEAGAVLDAAVERMPADAARPADEATADAPPGSSPRPPWESPRPTGSSGTGGDVAQEAELGQTEVQRSGCRQAPGSAPGGLGYLVVVLLLALASARGRPSFRG